jgi:thioredoxin 1
VDPSVIVLALGTSAFVEVIAMSQVPLPTVDDETFQAEVLAAAVPVLVEFGAAWCPPCRALEPILAHLAAEGAGRWKVMAVDIDASPGLSAKCSVRGAPTVILFANGVEVGRHLGLTRRETLMALIQRCTGEVERAREPGHVRFERGPVQ